MCVKIQPEGRKKRSKFNAQMLMKPLIESRPTKAGDWSYITPICLTLVARSSHNTDSFRVQVGRSDQILAKEASKSFIEAIEAITHYKKYSSRVKYWQQNVTVGINSESTHYTGCGYDVILNDQFHWSLKDISISRYYQTILPFKDIPVS